MSRTECTESLMVHGMSFIRQFDKRGGCGDQRLGKDGAAQNGDNILSRFRNLGQQVPGKWVRQRCQLAPIHLLAIAALDPF